MTDKIKLMGAAISTFVAKRKIVARCELLQMIYEAVRRAELSSEEIKEAEGLVGGKRLAPGIFASILSGTPIFFDFPSLDSFTVFEGRIFHFIHTEQHSQEDFKRAHQQFVDSRNELLLLLSRNLLDLISEFLIEAGYEALGMGQAPYEARFSKGDQTLTVLSYPKIGMVNLDQCVACAGDHPNQCVVVVPHEESLQPFMSFYSRNAADFEESGISVYVANMEQGTIDPFIGFTTDMDIYTQFKNPRLSAMVRSTWPSK
jgi:hypothetical protein